jgi:hypothetical protein
VVADGNNQRGKKMSNLSDLKKQALEMMQYVPDDKVVYLIDILKGLIGLYGESTVLKAENIEMTETWEDFKQYYGVVTEPIDEKKELAQARSEKYAHFA